MNGLQQEMFAAHNKILAYLVKLSHMPIENGQQYLSINGICGFSIASFLINC